jgi:hypothetical protein
MMPVLGGGARRLARRQLTKKEPSKIRLQCVSEGARHPNPREFSFNTGRRACMDLSHADPETADLPISYNIAPSQMVLTIRFNPETGRRRRRSFDALQWGLIPHWAKDSKIAYKTINARVETKLLIPIPRHLIGRLSRSGVA